VHEPVGSVSRNGGVARIAIFGKDILNAGLGVNARFQELRLDQGRAEDAVRLSRTLAQRIYSVLRQEILDETARIKRVLAP